MVKRFLAAGVLAAGIWSSAAAQVAVLDQLRAMASVPAENVGTPPSSPPSANAPAAETAAESALERIRRIMESGMSPERRRFMDQKVFTAVIPPRMNIVDKVVDVIGRLYSPEEAAPQIATIRRSYAARAESGPVKRVPQIPRGLTQDFDLGGGRVICFAGEENLVGQAEWDPNGSRRWRVAVHELGHAVHRTFSDGEWAQLKPIAIDYFSEDPKDHYREGDEKEMFAIATEIWFGVHQSDLNRKGMDAGTFSAKYPSLARFLKQVYGPARDVRP